MQKMIGMVTVLALLGCGPKAPRSQAVNSAAARATDTAVTELREGRFASADREALAALSQAPQDSRAAAVHAITSFQVTMHELITTATRVLDEAGREFDHAAMRGALEATDRGLAQIDKDLAVVAKDEDFSLQLCLACWKRDWNRNGRVDDRDGLLFQIERDESGKELAEDDPRRKPTFRFDVGDAHWARAIISFQRALINLALAYEWAELDKVLGSLFGPTPVIRIPLRDRARVATARQLFLAGLAHSMAARAAYLRESDDEGEWVPNPTQKNHPLPLPVDQALYDTWGAVVGDLTQLIAGDEGLDVAEIAQLGDHQWEKPPRGFLDVGRMLSEPRDLVLDGPALKGLDIEKDPESVLRSVFGGYYVPSMKPSGLIKHAVRMKNELDRKEDTFERKLRYLFWIN